MLTALLLYGYSRGLYSSRQLARACEERLDVMAVTGLNRPDFRTISDFRKRHQAALAGLFEQVLRLCGAAGLIRFGHVAVDGTKLRANASKHKAMSYGRMVAQEPRLAAEVAAWFSEAEAVDAAEDAEHGPARGDEMPDWVCGFRRSRPAVPISCRPLIPIEVGQGWRSPSGWFDLSGSGGCGQAATARAAVLRRLSPCRRMRWALCTRRSRMASARVGSPINSCQRSTGTWLVTRVAPRP